MNVDCELDGAGRSGRGRRFRPVALVSSAELGQEGRDRRDHADTDPSRELRLCRMPSQGQDDHGRYARSHSGDCDPYGPTTRALTVLCGTFGCSHGISLPARWCGPDDR